MTWRPVDLDPVAIVMVGKPARGKTFTAQRLARYTNWLGYRSRVFNVGSYRRERLGAGQRADFFDPDNSEGVEAREAMANAAVSDLIRWLGAGGEVAVLDATNSTRARRAWVRQRLRDASIPIMFVEVVCEDPTIIGRNVREVKVDSPDYAGHSHEEAVDDFFARIQQYEDVYETLDPALEGSLSFVRIIDLGQRIELEGIHGYLPGRLVSFLMHLHDRPRPIYLTRHGESAFNVLKRIGGDSPLSERGRSYAEALGRWLEDRFAPADNLIVWTSTMQRTVETSAPLGRRVRSWKILDEIDAGTCDGMTYEEIAETLPDEFRARAADKFRYRYPRGESYQDIIARLEPVVLELERMREPVVVIAHQAVLRAMYCYLTGGPPERSPYVDIPLHTVIRITPGPYGHHETRFPLLPTDEATH